MPTRANDEMYYDYFLCRHASRPTRQLDRFAKHNREHVVRHLISDSMEDDDPIAHLYAMLLVRHFLQADPVLMEKFGPEIAEHWAKEEPTRTLDEDELPPRRQRRTSR